MKFLSPSEFTKVLTEGEKTPVSSKGLKTKKFGGIKLGKAENILNIFAKTSTALTLSSVEFKWHFSLCCTLGSIYLITTHKTKQT
jgi:hypothetical protein